MSSINDLATAATAAAAAALQQQTGSGSGSSSTDNGKSDAGGEAIGTVTVVAAAAEEDAPAPIRGALVVLEGLDRSGKTTQVKLLEQRFVELGRKVKTMRFPGEFVGESSYF